MERSEKVFKEFIDLCREVTNNDTVVLELLQKRYNRTNLHFLWSNDFPDLIDRCRQKIQADRDNKYVYIKEFTTELKAYKAKPLKHLRDTRATAKGDGGSQVRKAEACPELEPPAKKPRLTNNSCNISHKPKERFETTSQFAKKVARQVQTPSCTLIPLSLMCNSPSGSNRDSISTGEASVEDERRDIASVGRRVFVTPVKVNEVPDLHLPQLQIVLEKSDVTTSQSQSSRQNLVESSSDDETDDNASTSKDRQSQLPHKEDGARDSRLQKHIEKLELLLKKISEEIKRLQETELSLEDMDREDSSYTLEDRYKKRFVKVWNRLCKLKGRDTTTGREIERKLNYCGTNYPEVNKSISRFVNKFRVFPDFSDIHEIIARSNRKHNLGIRKSAIDRLAREAFTDVGNILQKRRMTDHVDNFGCHLTENVKSRDDPALFDSRLRQRLDDNSKVSKTNLDEIISKYAQKQDEDPGQEEEEEEEEDEEEEEEDVEGEDEKKFMEDMEQIEEIVLTDESSVEPEEEDEEELDKENGSKENESKENNAGSVSKDNIDGANIDLCTDKSVSESLSLLGDTSDELDDLPLFCETPIERHSDDQRLNFSDSLPTTECEPTVLSSENDTEKAEDVENVSEERVLPVEEESMDISIVDPPLPLSSSSAADVQTLPHSSRPTDSPLCISSSSEVIGFGSAAIVNGSLASDSTSDEVEPVNALVPVATPIDVICLDDETNSPVKNKFHSFNGSTETQDIGHGTLMKQTSSKEKLSSMALGLVRLKPPCENVLRRFTKVDSTSHRKALSLRQPTTDASPPPLTEAVTGSSDEEDVVEIMSIPAPNGRTDFGSAAIRQEVRSSTNTTQSTSRVGRRNNSTDECCIMTTVEEHVVSTVVTSSRDETRSDGVRGQQVEMRQHTKKTMRVVGQIVHFNADPYGRSRQKQPQPRMNAAMQGSSRISQMNHRQQQQAMHSVNHRSTAEMNHRPSGPSRQPTLATRVTGQANRGSLAAVPATSLNKQLDDISSQIVSSIFKNQPKKSSSTDSDVIICDDSSPSVNVVSPTTTNKASKQTVNRVNWVTSNPRKNIFRQMEPRGTVARTSQGSRALLAARSSSHNQNGMHLSPKPSHPSRTLPQLPDVIELI